MEPKLISTSFHLRGRPLRLSVNPKITHDFQRNAFQTIYALLCLAYFVTTLTMIGVVREKQDLIHKPES